MFILQHFFFSSDPVATKFPAIIGRHGTRRPFTEISTTVFLTVAQRHDHTRCQVAALFVVKSIDGKERNSVAVEVEYTNGSGRQLKTTILFERLSTPSLADKASLPSYDSVYLLPRKSAGIADIANAIGMGKYKIVDTITFTGLNKPSILDLAALLLVASESFPRYHLYRTQCFFYAALNSEVLRSMFGGTESGREPEYEQSLSDVNAELAENQDDKSVGKSSGNVLSQSSLRPGERGTYIGSPIVTPKGRSFKSILDSFTAEFTSRRKELLKSPLEEANKRVLEAEARAEAEREKRLKLEKRVAQLEGKLAASRVS